MMKKNRIMIMTVMVALFSLLTASAQTDSLWTVSGKVLDAKSHKAMMSVSVTDGRVGTVTNEDGEFTLKLTREPSEVIFSCLGYKSVRLSAAACKAQESQRKPILLQPSTVMLSEVVVEGYEARQILSKAIDKIKVNYPRQPNLLRGFYRETVQKRQRFVAISEGVVDLYKSGYTKSDYRDGVKILKGRRLLSQRSSDTLGVKLQGGPVLPITFDVVKDRDILLNDAELEHYSIRFKNPEMADGRMQYVIELKPRHYLPYALFNALFYIDRESLAFTKVELHLDMSEPEKVTEMILKKRPVGLRFTPRELTVIVDYKTDNGVTRLNYIRNVIGFRCDWKRKLFKSNFTIVSEMVVTECQENDSIRPIRVRDTFNRTDKFYDKVIYFSDPNFWGKENIIEPTEDLLKGIDKIRRRLGR